MTEQDKASETVFNPGQADRIRDKAVRRLDEDQRALLLALARLEAETGHELSDAEKEALAALRSELKGFDPSEIEDAIRQMVNRPTDPDRKTSWSELKDHLD